MSLLEKIRELTEPLHTFFWSDEPRFLCEDICFQYGIPEDTIGDVTWFVAPLLTKSLPLSNLPQELRVKFPELADGVIFGLAFELNQKLLQKFPEQFPETKTLLSEWKQKKSNPALSEQEAHAKTLKIESWYLDWKRENEQEEALAPREKVQQTVSLPLLDALSKYQRLAEQAVTEDRIAVKGESQPVRGSIRNWLRNYRDSVGIRKHSTVERGQFLFQSDNTKRLSAAEREKLSLILRSLDENIPVSIDVERQEIVFPAVEEKEPAQSPLPAERAIPSLETSFRPLEKFPAQAAPIQKVLEWNAKTQSTEPSQRENASVSNQEAKNTKAAPFESKALSTSVPPARAVGVSTPVYGVPTHDQVLEAPFASKGNISFSSSHVLPHEKADEKTVENPQKKQESARSTPEPVSRGPEAISIIKPRGNAFGFRRDASGNAGSAAGGGFDAPRVVNLRSSGGIRQDKTGV